MKSMLTPSFLERVRRSCGGAFIELVLVIPVLIIPLAALVDFGLYHLNAHQFETVARDAARYATTLNSLRFESTPGTSELPAVTDVKNNIVDRWLAMHPNIGSIRVEVPQIVRTGYSLNGQNSVACDRMVTVTLRGEYQYSFLSLLGFKTAPLVRTVSMRWLKQPLCS